LFCGVFLFRNGLDNLFVNFKNPIEGSITTALFFGFAAAMLGISGFESSANYVEEQQDGVFPKTLRNMWIIVTIFNPLIAFLALAILPMASIDTNSETLLSFMGQTSGGNWLFYIISIDAVLVLSGAVLTSFVGVGGLVERMTLDRILPKFLIKKNKKGSSYIIFICFFILCVTILLFTHGNLKALAGVYTIAFLSVMILFAIGNILLKINRKHLPRPEKASIGALFFGIVGVLLALLGNMVLNPPYLSIFSQYLIPTSLVVIFMLYRIRILKMFLGLLAYFIPSNTPVFKNINKFVQNKIRRINSQEFVFFTNHDNASTINKAILYIIKNEHTRRLKIVAVLQPGFFVPPNLKTDIDVLDRAYPNIHIEFVEEQGHFDPDKIKELSKKYQIPINFMFIGSPGDKFPYRIQELGDVRLII